MNSPKQQMNPESKLLLPRVTCTIKAQMILSLESQAKRIALCRIFVGLDGSESEFWSVLGCVFYLFGVRVTENIEVGYGVLTIRITGGQSVKI